MLANSKNILGSSNFTFAITNDDVNASWLTVSADVVTANTTLFVGAVDVMATLAGKQDTIDGTTDLTVKSLDIDDAGGINVLNFDSGTQASITAQTNLLTIDVAGTAKQTITNTAAQFYVPLYTTSIIASDDISTTGDSSGATLTATGSVISPAFNSSGTTTTFSTNSVQMLSFASATQTASFGNTKVSTIQLDINAGGELNNVNGLTDLGSTDITTLTVSSDLTCTGDVFANTAGKTAYFNDLEVSGNFVFDGEDISDLISTGLISGGELSVVDGTHFAITDGTGVHIDTTTRAITAVSWTGLTNVEINATLLASNLITFIEIDSTGAVVQSATRPEEEDFRNYIFLGVVVHVNKTSINTVNQEQAYVLSPCNQLMDLYEAIGFINIDNRITPNGANMQFDKSAGYIVAHGINFVTDSANPNKKALAAWNSLTNTFQYRLQNGTNITPDSTVIDPTIYDDGTSTPATVPTNKWTIQHVYISTTGNVKIQPGQNIYNSLSEAEENYLNEIFVIEASVRANLMFIGHIFVKQSCTALNNAATALLISAGKFDSGVGGAAGGGSGTLQGSYDNAVSAPHIIINNVSSTGAVQIKGDAAVANVLSVLDESDVENLTIGRNGDLNAASTLYVDSANNRVGINKAAPTFDLEITGSGYASTIFKSPTLEATTEVWTNLIKSSANELTIFNDFYVNNNTQIDGNLSVGTNDVLNVDNTNQCVTIGKESSGEGVHIKNLTLTDDTPSDSGIWMGLHSTDIDYRVIITEPTTGTPGYLFSTSTGTPTLKGGVKYDLANNELNLCADDDTCCFTVGEHVNNTVAGCRAGFDASNNTVLSVGAASAAVKSGIIAFVNTTTSSMTGRILYAFNTDTMTFRTGSVDQMTITNNDIDFTDCKLSTTGTTEFSGNNMFGGTATPESSIHVRGSRATTPTDYGVHIGHSGSSTGNYGMEIVSNVAGDSVIDFTEPSQNVRGRILYDNGDEEFKFMTNGTYRMTLDSSGNLDVNLNSTRGQIMSFLGEQTAYPVDTWTNNSEIFCYGNGQRSNSSNYFGIPVPGSNFKLKRYAYTLMNWTSGPGTATRIVFKVLINNTVVCYCYMDWSTAAADITNGTYWGKYSSSATSQVDVDYAFTSAGECDQIVYRIDTTNSVLGSMDAPDHRISTFLELTENW